METIREILDNNLADDHTGTPSLQVSSIADVERAMQIYGDQMWNAALEEAIEEVRMLESSEVIVKITSLLKHKR